MRRRTVPKPDPGLEQIDAWGRWFLQAHRDRLWTAGLTPIEYSRELAAVEKMAAAVLERMTAAYRARQAQ